MFGYNHNRPATGNLVRSLMTLSMICVALCAAPPAFALDTGDIVITSLKGEVHVVMSGAERAVRAGAVLELPATVRTGADGAIELRQGATTVGVGPDTLLEFPALEKPGGPIDRIVQPRGSAFYSVGKREKRKLRIETPYLVGVVKGTQFNVVAQDGSTTISLFEGLLEIRSAVDTEVIDLHAGEIASRSRADAGINVLKMGGDAAPSAPRKPAASPAPAAPQGKPEPATESPRRAAGDADSLFVERDASSNRAVTGAPAANVSAETPLADVGAAFTPAPDTGAPAISVPVVSIPVDTAVQVDSIAGVGSPVSLGVDVGVSAPPVDLGVSAGNDGAGVADVAVNIAASPGVGVPADVSIAIDVNAPIDVPANVDLDTTVGNGNVSLDISVGGADTSVNVNLGLDDDNSGQGSSNSGSGDNNDNSGRGNNGNGQGKDDTGVVNDVTSALDALRGKSGRK